METTSVTTKEHLVKTSSGYVSVSIFGDQDKPALITYPNFALNHMSCFQGLFLCPEAFSLLIHNFCIYHINPPGHESFCSWELLQCPMMIQRYDLADKVAEVLDYFGLAAVMCMGVTAGAYILTLFALMANILYYYGMCGIIKELLLIRYFSKEVRGGAIIPETELDHSSRKLLDERQSPNVFNFLEAINGRLDITEGSRTWIDCNGGTTRCNVDTMGIFAHGLLVLQTLSDECKSKKPVKPDLYLPRALYAQKHGFKAETD